MAHTADIDPDETKEFIEQDKRWTGPKYIQLGIVTLIVSIAIIYYLSSLSGCSVVVVP